MGAALLSSMHMCVTCWQLPVCMCSPPFVSSVFGTVRRLRLTQGTLRELAWDVIAKKKCISVQLYSRTIGT